MGGRLLWATTAGALALAVASGRLLEGVHYLHEVAAGAIWGLIVPTLLILTVAIARTRVCRRLRRNRP
ncbi:hypothetical protein LLS1_28240 [Leifsonia sp. LS1]|nr:hypothetical protein LLS1_28240 [Leifsonia sp. LS1]